MVSTLSDSQQVSVDVKKRLQEEIAANAEKTRKAIRRHVQFRRSMLVFAAQCGALIPYFLVIFYYFAPRFPSPTQDYMLPVLVPYMILLGLLGFFLMKKQLKRSCRLACLYTSVNAAMSLEKNNIVEGSFFVTRLFEFLKDFAEEEKVQIGYFPSNLKKLFLGNIERLREQSKAVGKAVIEGCNLKEVTNNLYVLADSLFSSQSEPKYDVANESLKFFMKNSEKYFEPATYLQQHKRLNSTIKALSEMGKIILVPILLFILWLVFGYK